MIPKIKSKREVHNKHKIFGGKKRRVSLQHRALKREMITKNKKGIFDLNNQKNMMFSPKNIMTFKTKKYDLRSLVVNIIFFRV